jgi:hypothetical protein
VNLPAAQAIAAGQFARSERNEPYSAVVVRSANAVVGRNLVRTSGDPTAHAEVEAAEALVTGRSWFGPICIVRAVQVAGKQVSIHVGSATLSTTRVCKAAGMRHLIHPWEYRHRHIFGVTHLAGASVAAAAGAVCLGYGAYGWAAFFLVVSALNLAVGRWDLSSARSASARP